MFGIGVLLFFLARGISAWHAWGIAEHAEHAAKAVSGKLDRRPGAECEGRDRACRAKLYANLIVSNPFVLDRKK
jgi:hypothetical protein